LGFSADQLSASSPEELATHERLTKVRGSRVSDFGFRRLIYTFSLIE